MKEKDIDSGIAEEGESAKDRCVHKLLSKRLGCREDDQGADGNLNGTNTNENTQFLTK